MDAPFTSALDLAAAIRRREISAVEALDACLAAVDRLDPELNAIVWRDDEAARAAARAADEASGDDAPFRGVPIPIKDLTPVAGWPVTYGSNAAPEGPSADSELCVEALRRAGFVLCGRTNAPEFGPITITENTRYGATRNPWDTGRTPGGSSGGAGAATAAGMFPLAHGNDGAGSIRVPASCCGLVGLKSSRGRIPRRTQSWAGAVVEGVVTHTVADTAAVLDTLAAEDLGSWMPVTPPARPYAETTPEAPGRLRIGLMAAGLPGIPVDPECTTAAERAGRALEDLGHEVHEVVVPTIDEKLIPNFVVVVQAGLADYPDIDWSKVEPHVAAQHRAALETSSFAYVEALHALERYARDVIGAWGRDFDVLVTPTLSIQPPPVGVLDKIHAQPDQPAMEVVQTVMFTAFANVTGQPALSLPLHWTDDGVPIGVQLVGAPHDDATVLRLGAQLEQALPWADRRPPLTAAAA